MNTTRFARLAAIAAILSIIMVPVLATDEQPTTYGAGVTLEKSVSLLKLLNKPEKYVGKSIRVEGTVGDVCPRMGCWMEIQGKDAGRHVKFKVKDGEMVFPMEAVGRSVVAQGVLEKIELSTEDAVSWAKHLADEKNEPFDETADVPTVLYQIRGTGAVIR